MEIKQINLELNSFDAFYFEYDKKYFSLNTNKAQERGCEELINFYNRFNLMNVLDEGLKNIKQSKKHVDVISGYLNNELNFNYRFIKDKGDFIVEFKRSDLIIFRIYFFEVWQDFDELTKECEVKLKVLRGWAGQWERLN